MKENRKGREDMTNYRKFMEPEYGEPAPEVIIYPSQEMDMEHLARWRKRMIMNLLLR